MRELPSREHCTLGERGMDLTTPLTNVKGIGPAREVFRDTPPGIAPAHRLVLPTEASEPPSVASEPRRALPESGGLCQEERHWRSEPLVRGGLAFERFSVPGTFDFRRKILGYLCQRVSGFSGKPRRRPQ